MPRPADFPNRRRLVARAADWDDAALDAHAAAARQLADDDDPAPSIIDRAIADARRNR